MRHDNEVHMTRCHSPGLLLRIAAVLFLGLCSTTAFPQTTQEMVHHQGHSVMPFDLGKTVHVFRMTESGGVQQVIVRNSAEKDQVALIQKHLQKEAVAFQQGDYADPASLHGAPMPGLKELQAGAKKITVSYAGLPNGAQITFKTADVKLLTAIHRWFGAQLSEHGADARAE
jgi:hypothetical protein